MRRQTNKLTQTKTKVNVIFTYCEKLKNELTIFNIKYLPQVGGIKRDKNSFYVCIFGL